MKAFIWFLFFLPIVFSAESYDPIKKEDDPYNYYQLVQQWPPTYCMRKSCKKFTDLVFTIHGLWPSYSSKPDPPICTGSTLDEKKIEPLKGELNVHWPNLEKKPNIEFWRNEWKKHGTCSEQYFNKTQYWYFNTALTLQKSVDLFTLLRNKGIEPGPNKHSQSDIRDAIKDRTNSKPHLWCRNTDTLLEISVCVDLSENFRDCPQVLEKYPNNQCKKEKIYYPKYVTLPPIDDDEKDEL